MAEPLAVESKRKKLDGRMVRSGYLYWSRDGTTERREPYVMHLQPWLSLGGMHRRSYSSKAQQLSKLLSRSQQVSARILVSSNNSTTGQKEQQRKNLNTHLARGRKWARLIEKLGLGILFKKAWKLAKSPDPVIDQIIKEISSNPKKMTVIQLLGEQVELFLQTGRTNTDWFRNSLEKHELIVYNDVLPADFAQLQEIRNSFAEVEKCSEEFPEFRIIMAETSQQDDAHSCGPLVIRYARRRMLGRPPGLEDYDASEIRADAVRLLYSAWKNGELVAAPKLRKRKRNAMPEYDSSDQGSPILLSE
ncbi:hypothetical protein ED733_000458 [Metarhizium rileyi]|uniref:Ubiquitin-like protease family profile domain-containing protein n=1 Tax=Metarhizium rileyi (strain RCEF 4871) TaxID=1649241 RepID=A0A5C6G1T9_METRR|nr:hypothetical protein ED733_000458 [Metarhizium rileyi]